MAEAVARVEFCSPEWMARAVEIVSALVAENAESIRGEGISICEVFLRPPPHLRVGNPDRFVWSFVIEDGVLAQAPANIHLPDAELYVEVDYDDVLPRARTVYSDDPDAARPGPPPQGGVRRGPISPKSLALRTVLRNVHNRLAEITA